MEDGHVAYLESKLVSDSTESQDRLQASVAAGKHRRPVGSSQKV